jgi:delta 1-pyrroline-5-carboxylate dehydrogenase
MQSCLRAAKTASRFSARSLSSRSQHGIFVGGAYKVPEGAKFFDVENPAKAEVIGRCVAATAADVHDAIERSHRVFQSGEWSRADVRHRANVLQSIATLLRQNLGELADLEVLQTGRSVREMKAQLGRLPEVRAGGCACAVCSGLTNRLNVCLRMRSGWNTLLP